MGMMMSRQEHLGQYWAELSKNIDDTESMNTAYTRLLQHKKASIDETVSTQAQTFIHQMNSHTKSNVARVEQTLQYIGRDEELCQQALPLLTGLEMENSKAWTQVSQMFRDKYDTLLNDQGRYLQEHEALHQTNEAR
ncbi:unnamed protein product [Candidula unifasciata]|uniref:Uncharacterized protein n=1 Tax=Candidula unifasciata TaxID=100452 RepID=A0A8S3ZW99_9EUPU|nr:unnamed protein product [Candidula unifasciata]